MNCLQIIVLLFIVISLKISDIECTKCYHCSSDVEPNCSDESKLADHQKVDCADIQPPSFIPIPFNVTKCTSFKTIVDNGVIVNRTCFWESSMMPYTDNCMKTIIQHIALKDCKVCTGDYCNGAQKSLNNNSGNSLTPNQTPSTGSDGSHNANSPTTIPTPTTTPSVANSLTTNNILYTSSYSMGILILLVFNRYRNSLQLI